MNPILFRVGIIGATALGAAIFGFGKLAWEWWKNHNEIQNSSNSDMHLGNFDGSGINICCICLSDFKNFDEKKVSLPCKHKYHKKCIQLLLKEIGSKTTCPVCRRVIPSSALLL